MRRRALIFTVILLALSGAAFCQPLKKEVDDYGFAHFDRNKITFQGDSSSFERVFSKLDTLRGGGATNLRIMYIGGSHVQGGTLTRQLRNDFLALGDSLDGGRGMVFPFWAAHTNTPTSFITRCGGIWTAAKNTQKNPDKRLGLTGMAISTSDSAAFVKIVTVPRKPIPGDRPYSFKVVKVLGYSSGGDRRPIVILENGDTLHNSQVTDSCFVFGMPVMTDSVTVSVAGTCGEFTITGMYLDNLRSGITLSGIGVNGASLLSYERCPDLVRDLKTLNPDLVIFGVGINDAAALNFSEELFVKRYHALVDKVLTVNPDCALLFVTNNDSYRHSRKKGYFVNTNGPLAEEAFLRLGKELDAGVWDLFDIMGGLKSMRNWESAGLARRDKIHFTDEGYELLGNLLFNALMDCWQARLDGRCENGLDREAGGHNNGVECEGWGNNESEHIHKKAE